MRSDTGSDTGTKHPFSGFEGPKIWTAVDVSELWFKSVSIVVGFRTDELSFLLCFGLQ
jgi:hypothetical protein